MKIVQTIVGAIAVAACAPGETGVMPEKAAETASASTRRAIAPIVYVMRHLERAEGPDPGLSEFGRRRAEAMLAFFSAEKPAAIYVSRTRRARETAAPLASALGLTPVEYDPLDPAGLAATITRERGPVLIVGHSNTVPEMIRILGGSGPSALPETAYGDIWRIEGRTTGHARLGE